MQRDRILNESVATDNQTRIIMLGQGAVGKSSITLRMAVQDFTPDYNPTLQEKFRKSAIVDGKAVNLEIVDTAGQEDFVMMLDGWIRDGQGFVLVYSVINENSFDDIKQLKKKIDRIKAGSSVSCIIVGNKIDLENNRVISKEKGKALANELGCLFIETSAKTGVNCEEVYIELVRDILKKKTKKPQKNKTGFFDFCNLL